MSMTDPEERRRVRVSYVPRGYGLALTIFDDETTDDGNVEAGPDDGYLTVVESGVTTLELRRPDGEPTVLVWDQSEVAWDSLQAG